MSKDPTITELLNLDSGATEKSIDLLCKPQSEVFQLRTIVENRLQTDNPLYACDICGQYVAIRSRKRRDYEGGHTLYFKHLHDSDYCPIKTGSEYDRDTIRRMKYNGQQESKAHFELKQYIAYYLHRDPNFSDINIEKVVKGQARSKSWKKPDISAIFNNRRVVFEIQLSTTFLDVIVSRERFYRDLGMSVFWIFKDLNPHRATATEKDVFLTTRRMLYQ